MHPFKGFHPIPVTDLTWRPSNLMKIPNADYLERTGSELLGARLWRLPPRSANTLHKHVRQEEFFFVLEGTGRIRINDTTLTLSKYGGVLVGPDALRQVFNDTDDDVLWLIVGAPEELEFLKGSKAGIDLSLFYPTDPKQLPPELAGVTWPPADNAPPAPVAPIDFSRQAEEWLAAWNAHDLERILSHYTDDVEFRSPFIQKLLGNSDGTLRGKPALRDYFTRGLATYPDLRFEFRRLYTGVQSIVLEYRSVNNLLATEMMDFTLTGKIKRVQAHYTPRPEPVEGPSPEPVEGLSPKPCAPSSASSSS